MPFAGIAVQFETMLKAPAGEMLGIGERFRTELLLFVSVKKVKEVVVSAAEVGLMLTGS